MSRMHRDRVRTHSRRRILIQTAAALLLNGYAAGFLHGKIWTGRSKAICVPVLNCYSCPAALGACPIGAMQAAAGSGRLPFYAAGTLALVGMLLGRLACGMLCPFGFIQDLLYRIPTKKLTVPRRADRILRYVKYAILLIFVLLLPMLITDALGSGAPWFCKYICPAGTLEGGIPLLLLNPALREQAGWLFGWKMLLLLLTVIGAAYISRFFCRYLCPLGAFYALFNRLSVYQMTLDRACCTGCAKCERVCPMQVEVRKSLCSGECIRCGKCKAACPEQAIK